MRKIRKDNKKMKEKLGKLLDITFKDNSESASQILRFVINITICYLIAYGAAKPFVLWVLKDSTKVIQDNLSMLVGMGLFVILNYLGQRLVVFKKDEEC